MKFDQRTHTCGTLSSSDSEQMVTLNGWIHRVRDLGGLFFADVRDRTGIVQLFFSTELFENLTDLRPEACISVTGIVKLRSPSTRNPKMPTGDIEVIVSRFQLLGSSKPLPFPVSDEEQMITVNEELRIKHRYLDLRRPSMNKRMAVRSELIAGLRQFLNEQDFLEIETPIITKSTPEGARDYLVPYRLDPGKWYALPQSPQQYKQLLMVGGIERYYQVAKCFRDESQRADRQPEFTQIDIELSFCTQEDILELTESMIRQAINQTIDKFNLEFDHVQPFERIDYSTAMSLYGSDKPDLRFDLPLFNVSAELSNCQFGVFRNALESGGTVQGLRYPGGAKLSRTEVSYLETFCKESGAKGMASLAIRKNEFGLAAEGSIAKFLTKDEVQSILNSSSAEEGDLLCFIADGLDLTRTVLGRLRLEIGTRLNMRDPNILKFVWVVDFPLVQYDVASGKWDPAHHPFTSPKPEDLHLLRSEPGQVKADCYDMVCNGSELASGSIRIHQADIQSQVFELLGIDEVTQKERFGHLLEAFSYGAPPHGGIACGIDRLLMLLFHTENIREVMAFPKVGGGYDPMMDAPSTIDPQQWAELGLRLSQ